MAAHSLSEEQIRYLRDVLGIQDVVLPTVLSDDSPSAPRFDGDLAKSRLVALFPLNTSEFPMRPEVRDLAEKMIRAMKLASDEVFWFEFVAGNEHSAEAVFDILSQVGDKPLLLFSDSAFVESLQPGFEYGKWIKMPQGGRIMPTHSIRSLIEDQSLKRPAWVHLQAVMKVL